MKKCFVFSVLCLATGASAWDGFGHQVVARVAYDRLTPQVQKKINAILRSHPGLANGTAKSDFQNLLGASTWPDRVRMSRYDHPTWHYIDFPFNVGAIIGPEPPATNAVTALMKIVDDSRPNLPDAQKSQDISWIAHLVGDMHQPLHCVSLFDQDHLPPKGDRGGNGFFYQGPRGGDLKLHAYWDRALELHKGNIAEVAAIVEARGKPAVPALPKEPTELAATVEGWAKESFGIAVSEVYRQDSGNSATTAPLLVDHDALPTGYDDRAYTIALRQANLGGARLAALLNRVYGDPTPLKSPGGPKPKAKRG